MKLTRENAILPAKSLNDLSAYVGCATVYGNHIVLGTRVELWNPNDHQDPNSVILWADAESLSVAILHGGLAGTVKVKLMEAVSRGSQIYPVNDGTNIGFADRTEERNPGNHYACGLALEDGVAGEMIEAVLFKPEAFTIA